MEYFLQITALALSFISFVLCFIFLFGKRFYLWLFELFISAVITAADGLFLFGLATYRLSSLSSQLTDYVSLFLTALSALYLIQTVILRIAGIPADTVKRRDRQSLSEARYVTVSLKSKNGDKEK